VAVWPDEPGWDLDGTVAEVFHATVDGLRSAGMRVDEVRPVDLDASLRLAQRVIQGGIAHGIPQDDYDALVARAAALEPDDDSPPARWARNITQSARDLNMALEEQSRLQLQWTEFFTGYDIVLTPVMRTTAIGHDHSADIDARTIPVNGRQVPYADQFAWLQSVGVADLPAVVAPVGAASDGLPVGIQIVAPYLHDRAAIEFARRLADVVGGYVPPPGFTS
jgi:amidase